MERFVFEIHALAMDILWVFYLPELLYCRRREIGFKNIETADWFGEDEHGLFSQFVYLNF
jgi:hypothetical protein